MGLIALEARHHHLEGLLKGKLCASACVVAVAFVIPSGSHADTALPTTDASAWSEEGFLGFRFGMGPGDVYALLHSPDSKMRLTKEWFEGTVQPGFSHSFIAQETTFQLLGQAVTTSFDFAKGRLVAIFMFPSLMSRQDVPVEKSVEEATAWGRSLDNALTEELGPPEELEREWRWLKGGTRFRSTAMGGLAIEDAVAVDAAEKEGELKPGQTRVEGKEPLPTARLNPDFWSKGGWRSLKWGMGPRDALDKLGSIRTVSWSSKGVARGRADPNVGDLYVKITDEDVRKGSYTALSFGDAGLERVAEHGLEETSSKSREADPHFEVAKRTLSRAHGRSACKFFVDGKTCEWRANGSRIQLRLRAVYADLLRSPDEWFTDITVEYSDPRLPDADGSRITEAELNVRTDPRTWSKVGVNGMRLGMGLGDVLDRIRGKADPLRRGLACQRSTDDRGYRCEMPWSSASTSDIMLHQMSFSASGRLGYASYIMHSASREDVQARFTELRDTFAPQFRSWTKMSYVKEDAFNYDDDYASASAHVLTNRPSEWYLSLYYMEHKRDAAKAQGDQKPGPAKKRVKRPAPNPESI